jgi:hypothetical protein
MLTTTTEYRSFEILIAISTEEEERSVLTQIRHETGRIFANWSEYGDYDYFPCRQKWILETLEKAINYIEDNLVSEKLNPEVVLTSSEEFPF